MKLIDLTGQKFHRLTVIKRHSENNKQNKPMWVCKCDCGQMIVVTGSDLKSGNTKSCGCWDKDVGRRKLTTHGYSKTRLYYIWSNMKDRCCNPNNKRYKDYGGRGIFVCDEWLHDFVAFREWAYKNGYDDTAPFGQCTIDRANNNDGYTPFNCVWSTLRQQAHNKRNTTHSQIYLQRRF